VCRYYTSESKRVLLDFINFTVVGDLNISLKRASRVSELLPDGTLEHQIWENDSSFLNFLITCNQSHYAHLYHDLEITVIGTVQGAFTIGLRDWVRAIRPYESDWACCASQTGRLDHFYPWNIRCSHHS
jgi:hypothetical protein